MNSENLKKDVERALSPKRYQHSIGVMERAEKLAKIYGVDIETARLVGIAHDIAKEMSEEEIKRYVKENNIKMDEVEKDNFGLLHGKIGADICKKKYGFTEEMQDAIKKHTAADVEMSKLDKILYLADHTEKNRTFKDVEYIRKLSETNLDEAVLYCMDRKIMHVIEQGKILDPKTVFARNKMLKEIESKI